MHRVIEKFPATVGRGFDSDVILPDPHVSPKHFYIDYKDGGWVVTDADSANGTDVNGIPCRAGGQPVRSGDSIRAGQTELRLFAPHHPVAEAMRLRKSHPVYARLHRPAAVWGVFFMAFAAMQGWAYLEIWTQETGMVLAAAAAAMAGGIMIWATLWSVAGRLARNKPNFRSHLIVASLYLNAALVVWYVGVYADFLASENRVSSLISYGLNFALLTLLLYVSLALATRMTERRRMAVSAFFSFGVLGGMLSIGAIDDMNFNQQPPYAATLRPYLSRLAPANTIGEFMAGNEKLFDGPSR